MKSFFSIVLFLLSLNVLIAQGRPDGPFKDFYESSELRVEGQYLNRKKVGEWKNYYKNGQISLVYGYTDGDQNRAMTSYYKEGGVSYKVKKEGDVYIRTGYYKSGALQYKREDKTGYYNSFYESGAKEIETNYLENEIVGYWKKYYESGQLEWLVNYNGGYRQGKYVNYYENGDVKLEGFNFKDKVEGEEKRYLKGNVLEWQGKYEAGVLIKTWVKYDADGDKIEKIKFKDGVATKPEFLEIINPTKVAEGVIERVPIYPGCESSLTNTARKKCINQNVAQFIVKNFNTDLGNTSSISGKQRIFLHFKIDKNGEVIDAKARAKYPALEREAVRVIRLLPKFQAATQRGKAVIVPFTLPIVFQVE